MEMIRKIIESSKSPPNVKFKYKPGIDIISPKTIGYSLRIFTNNPHNNDNTRTDTNWPALFLAIL